MNMGETLVYVYWEKDGKLTLWLEVGPYIDPDHPRRKFCYSEGGPGLCWLEVNTLTEAMDYICSKVINWECIQNGRVDRFTFSKEKLQ